MDRFIFTDNDNVVILITECPAKSYYVTPNVKRLCAADAVELNDDFAKYAQVDLTNADVVICDELLIA